MIDRIAMNNELLIMTRRIKGIQAQLADIAVGVSRLKEEPMCELKAGASVGEKWFSALDLLHRCSAEDMAVIAQKSTATMLRPIELLRLIAEYGSHRSLNDILMDHDIPFRVANGLFSNLIHGGDTRHHGWRIEAYRHPGFKTEMRWRYKLVRDEGANSHTGPLTEAQSVS